MSSLVVAPRPQREDKFGAISNESSDSNESSKISWVGMVLSLSKVLIQAMINARWTEHIVSVHLEQVHE